MIISTLRPLRILLLGGLGAAFAPVLLAQVSPLLAPLLTQDPQTAPITTLAIDLLTPQRTYVFDATGASVLANDLNPSIYASTLSSAPAETDTAVRDSSQTGHLSPFASGTTRLGLSFSGGEGSAAAGTPSTLAAATNPEPGTEMDAAYRSGWGTSSSFGSQATGSSWGTRAFHVERLGRGQSGSSNTGTSLNTGASLNAERLGRRPVWVLEHGPIVERRRCSQNKLRGQSDSPYRDPQTQPARNSDDGRSTATLCFSTQFIWDGTG